MYCSSNVFSKQSYLFKLRHPSGHVGAQKRHLVGLQERSCVIHLETSNRGKNGSIFTKKFCHSTSNKISTRTKTTGVLDAEGIHESSNIETTLDFEDFEKAFKAKSTGEITRALMVYKLCSFDFLVNRNKMVSVSFFNTFFLSVKYCI